MKISHNSFGRCLKRTRESLSKAILQQEVAIISGSRFIVLSCFSTGSVDNEVDFAFTEGNRKIMVNGIWGAGHLRLRPFASESHLISCPSETRGCPANAQLRILNSSLSSDD